MDGGDGRWISGSGLCPAMGFDDDDDSSSSSSSSAQE